MFNTFRNRMAVSPQTIGASLDMKSKEIIDRTFTKDPAYRVAYIAQENPIRGDKSIDIKFFEKTKVSVSNVQSDFYVQFRPGVEVLVGSYIYIPDANGTYNWWLIINKDDKIMLPNYYVLKCNWTAVWKVENKYYSCLGVRKSRNSYNSGVWSADTFTVPENQSEIWFPTTNVTRTLSYNHYMIIGNNPLHPVKYDVTKVDDTLPLGVTKVTLYQKQVGEIQDEELIRRTFEANNIQLIDTTLTDAGTAQIKYSGRSTVTMAGNYKKFTAVYFDANGNALNDITTLWDIQLPAGLESLFDVITADNVVQIKCMNYYNSSGADSIMVKATGSNGICTQIDVKVVG